MIALDKILAASTLLLFMTLIPGCVPNSYRVANEMERAANSSNVTRVRALRSGPDGETAAKSALLRMRIEGNVQLARMLFATGTSAEAIPRLSLVLDWVPAPGYERCSLP